MIAIQDIAYVRYQVLDLASMESFLTDFGMRVYQRTDKALYMRAHGQSPYVHVSELGDSNKPIGIGVRAKSESDLHHLAEKMNAVVETISEPGGGKRVRLTDPSGFIVDVVHGQELLAPLEHRAPLEMNPATARVRKGRVIRLKPQPSSVMRLGHVALLVPDFKASFDFYTQVLGMKPSDTYFAGSEDNTIAAFLHCGLGSEYTDHHTIAVISSQDGKARFDHSAFEVIDLDDVVQGGEYLKSKNRHHSWGVGRHIQGSQIFDYWRDPFGNKIEHWTDGDVVNDETPVGNAPISGDELAQWAPPLNPEFFQ